MMSFKTVRTLGLALTVGCGAMVTLAACSDNGKNGAGLSPALIAPPSKFIVRRMRRRAGCASAVNTAS